MKKHSGYTQVRVKAIKHTPNENKSMIAKMTTWSKDPFVKGLVLEIDTGGGGQVSSALDLVTLSKKFSKPVEVYADNINGSAGKIKY